MASKSKSRRAPEKPMPDLPNAVPKEFKAALVIALPFGALAAVILNWHLLFPVPPEQLVEVAWTHECRCVSNWMKSLRAEGFTVRDVEIDDLSTMRRNWHVPNTARGCHPASYMGYFIDGHFTAENLRRIAREHPGGIGLKIKDARPGDTPASEAARPEMVLVTQSGAETPWP